MSNRLPVGWIVGGVAALVVVFGGMSAINANNYAARAELQINATWDNNKNVLGTYTTKIAEMAQIPGMQTANLSKVMEAAFQGRYGSDGSKATVQWIKENYPGQLDNKLYERLMETMDAGRTEFRDNQTKLIDQKREYETQLATFPNGFFMHLAGYPKLDMNKFNVVTSSSAEHSFSTGVDDGVKLPQ